MLLFYQLSLCEMRPIVWLIFALVRLSVELEINITTFDNCYNVLENGELWPIEIQEVHYVFNDGGYIDHIYGTYLVRSIDTRDKELTIMTHKCSIGDPPLCEQQVEHIIVDLQCDKFRNDDFGIWYMISQAMSGSICGHEMGLFKFDIPTINREYFEKYLMGGDVSSSYRMVLLFHKKSDESIDRRACVEIKFDVFQ